MNKKKILVVDNHPAFLKFMKSLIEKRGNKVVTAQDGLLALNALKNYNPDIAFLDLVMPNISGDKLCRIIRTMPNLKNTYIVILSGIAAEETFDFLSIGADACIAKGPFNKIAEHVIEILDKYESGLENDMSQDIKGIGDIYQREITKELLSIKKHFDVIANNICEGFIEITSDGIIISANPIAVLFSGISEEKLLGKKFINIFEDYIKSYIQSKLDECATSNKYICEDSGVSLNDRYITIDIVPLNYDDIQTYIIILRDITERKKIQDALNNYRDELEQRVAERTIDIKRTMEEKALIETQFLQAQKMEAIGSLAGGIAHDFNNVLMGILGTVSLILNNTYDYNTCFGKIKNIEEYAIQGSRLTQQLLGLSKGGKVNIKNVNLTDIINKSLDMFGRTKKEIRIHKKFDENLWAANIDQGQIEQALLNLYINAWQAMPNGGEIYIQTENIILKEDFVKPFEIHSGNFIVISVTDTGVGIEKEILHKIFEPFFTTKIAGTGTGLGLASTYRIIKNHGGMINVYSEKNIGTTFRIYLPASSITNVVSEQDLSIEIQRGSETIFIIDDQELILEVNSELLKELGYTVIKTNNAISAISIYKEKFKKIDIVILDLIMPDMSGKDLYDALKNINPDIKTLIVSGYGIDEYINEILKKGCNDFLQKPFNLNNFSKKIREILDKAI